MIARLEGKEAVMESDGAVKQIRPRTKMLYGLPCAQCKAYYAADLTSCPVCQCRERVPGFTELPSGTQ
jgi:hypothetical protein